MGKFGDWGCWVCQRLLHPEEDYCFVLDTRDLLLVRRICLQCMAEFKKMDLTRTGDSGNLLDT